ncbi:MAG: hypothetical protein Q7U32_01495 [Rhodocyclaceae bacterium]|jgi:hypothetical protein|nr:hypothetical protein [Rhodocyclaceae bacterium]
MIPLTFRIATIQFHPECCLAIIVDAPAFVCGCCPDHDVIAITIKPRRDDTPATVIGMDFEIATQIRLHRSSMVVTQINQFGK